MALADYLRNRDHYERLGPLGIATRGRCHSVLLFSKRPIRQLDGATIGISEQTSTSVLLLRLLLEQRYQLPTPNYVRVGSTANPEAIAASNAALAEAEARLLIGDEALTFQASNKSYPYEVDLAFEWWLWQHLPAVFAVWVVRKDAPADEKQRISRTLQHQLAVNLGRLETIAAERAAALGLDAGTLHRYLANFVYRFSEPEEQAIRQFESLVNEHHLL